MRNSQEDNAEYPLGTVMAYGPTANHATKLVATVFAEPDSAPVAMRRWFVADGDIRDDSDAADGVAAFFRKHKTRRTIVSERIAGCPHEEGVDYPLGHVCPECPFWAETDRLTHGPKSPTDDAGAGGFISADEIMVALSEERGQPPREAFKAADARRAELTDRLLAALEAGLAAPSDVPGNVRQLFCHALYLFAKWREPRAFPFLIRLLSLPGEAAFDLTDDLVNEDGARILASVSGGDRPEIRALVENRDAEEFHRSVALDSLAVLYAWDELPRETVIGYLRELITDRLERESSFVWGEVACLIADLEATELVPFIRQPYEEGLVQSSVIGWSEIENPVSYTERPRFEQFREDHPLITDVAEETEWWAMYAYIATRSDEIPEDVDFPYTLGRAETAPFEYEPPIPSVAAPKIGRNDQCPCGSGKKFKKCCGGNA